MFKKHIFPEYDTRYISDEFLKFGDIEIEKGSCILPKNQLIHTM